MEKYRDYATNSRSFTILEEYKGRKDHKDQCKMAAKSENKSENSHSNLLEQEPATVTISNVQQRLKNMKSWAASGPEIQCLSTA